jgi:SAM-dependent methyltransferase
MAAMKSSLGLSRADTLRMEQPMRRRSSPLQSLSMRAFGRPKGVLGKLGGVIMAWTNRAIAARVVELLNIQPSDRVLEVGFGPGVGIQLIAEKATSGEVAGIDCSEEMVEQATARNASAVECGRVELQLGSVERLRSRTKLSTKRWRSIRCRSGPIRWQRCDKCSSR